MRGPLLRVIEVSRIGKMISGGEVVEHRFGVAHTVAEDGTVAEDLDLYRTGLQRYRQWWLSEAPADYLGRLERLLDALQEDLAEMDRLLRLSPDVFAADRRNSRLAYYHLFHAFVVFLDGTKWLLAREMPDLPAPSSFSGAVALLADRGVLPVDRQPAYREFCLLRNRLAHGWDWTPSPMEMRELLARHAPVLFDLTGHLRLRYLGGGAG